jgi:hypothetical protein
MIFTSLSRFVELIEANAVAQAGLFVESGIVVGTDLQLAERAVEGCGTVACV